MGEVGAGGKHKQRLQVTQIMAIRELVVFRGELNVVGGRMKGERGGRTGMRPEKERRYGWKIKLYFSAPY